MEAVPDESAERSAHFGQLRRSLRRLISAGTSQPSLFPEEPVTAGQLATEFDQSTVLVRGTHGNELSGEQLEALAALERQLATMSRDVAEFDVELWTESALRSSEAWSHVRRLAALTLEAFESPSDADSPVRSGAEIGRLIP